jgi:hypothetical protein
LRPLRGRHAYKASTRSALPNSLQLCKKILVPLLFVRQKPCLSFSSLFQHQTSHAACFNARGLHYECVFDTLLFSSSHRLAGKPVSHHVVIQSTVSSLLFFWIILPAILPATMLGYYSMSASLMPSEIFSSSFRSIGSLLPIGRHSTSLSLRFHLAELLNHMD